MATEIGKVLKKLRIDVDEILVDMAEKVGKSASFISAIEVGKKSPPVGFEEVIIKAYKLDSRSAGELRDAADRSRRTFVVEPKSSMGREAAGLLARKINTLSDADLKSIQAILKGSDSSS